MSNLRRVPYTKPIPEGAQLFTRKGERFARFKDGRGKTVEAPITEDGKRVRLLSKKWYGEYRDQDGIERCVPLATDKTAAEQMLADLVRKAELAKAGVIDPFEAHRKRPLREHLADFRAYLLAKGDGAKHARDCARRVGRILDACGFVFIADLSTSRVQEFLAGLRRQGRALPPLDPAKAEYTKAELAAALGVRPHCIGGLVRRWRLAAEGNGKRRRFPRATAEALRERLDRGAGTATVNHYARAARAFTRWLVKDRRAGDDPLAALSGIGGAADVRHARRALTSAELSAVLGKTLCSPRAFRGLSGADRFHVYLTACGTGFRASELAALLPGSFDLAADPPTATVPGAYTKNKRLAVQPLPPDVAEALRGYLAGLPAGQPVWPGSWSEDAAEMLQADLEAAGIPYTVEGPDGPLHADFHALRHSYIRLLDQAGATLKEAMQLARHSDPKLTMAVYGRAQIHDLGQTVRRLPLLPGSPGAEAARATGTDGQEGGNLRQVVESFRPACATASAGGVRLLPVDDGGPEKGDEAEGRNPLDLQEVAAGSGQLGSVEDSAPRRTRTYNPLIKSQLLCQLS